MSTYYTSIRNVDRDKDGRITDEGVRAELRWLYANDANLGGRRAGALIHDVALELRRLERRLGLEASELQGLIFLSWRTKLGTIADALDPIAFTANTVKKDALAELRAAELSTSKKKRRSIESGTVQFADNAEEILKHLPIRATGDREPYTPSDPAFKIAQRVLMTGGVTAETAAATIEVIIEMALKSTSLYAASKLLNARKNDAVERLGGASTTLPELLGLTPQVFRDVVHLVLGDGTATGSAGIFATTRAGVAPSPFLISKANRFGYNLARS